MKTRRFWQLREGETIEEFESRLRSTCDEVICTMILAALALAVGLTLGASIYYLRQIFK